MKAAHRHQCDQTDKIIVPRELVEAEYVGDRFPSLAARRTLLLFLEAAAGDAWKPMMHRVRKGDIRRTHKSNRRLPKLLDEVSQIRLRTVARSSRDREATGRIALFEDVPEERATDDTAWVEFVFTESARRIFRDSAVYAELDRRAVLAIESRFTLRLYEIGSLMCGRRCTTMEVSLEDLCQIVGSPRSYVKDFAKVRREILDRAKAELNVWPAPPARVI